MKRVAGGCCRVLPPLSCLGLGRGADRAPGTGKQDAGEAEPDHGACRDRDEQGAADALEVGACCERVPEREHEGGEARVVQPAPAALADSLPHPEGHREHEREPAGDDAGRDCGGTPCAGKRREHRGEPEVQGGVEEQRSRVQGEHREPRPGERLVPAEERLLPLRAEQARAHPEPEPDGEGEEAEGDEAGGAGDVPGHGRLCEEGVHRAAPEIRMRGSSTRSLWSGTARRRTDPPRRRAARVLARRSGARRPRAPRASPR